MDYGGSRAQNFLHEPIPRGHPNARPAPARVRQLYPQGARSRAQGGAGRGRAAAPRTRDVRARSPAAPAPRSLPRLPRAERRLRGALLGGLRLGGADGDRFRAGGRVQPRHPAPQTDLHQGAECCPRTAPARVARSDPQRRRGVGQVLLVPAGAPQTARGRSRDPPRRAIRPQQASASVTRATANHRHRHRHDSGPSHLADRAGPGAASRRGPPAPRERATGHPHRSGRHRQEQARDRRRQAAQRQRARRGRLRRPLAGAGCRARAQCDRAGTRGARYRRPDPRREDHDGAAPAADAHRHRQLRAGARRRHHSHGPAHGGTDPEIPCDEQDAAAGHGRAHLRGRPSRASWEEGAAGSRRIARLAPRSPCSSSGCAPPSRTSS